MQTTITVRHCEISDALREVYGEYKEAGLD